jgi:hypothetical protein
MKSPKVVLLFIAAVAVPLRAGPPGALTAGALWEAWPGVRVSPADPWSLRRSGLDATLASLDGEFPGLFSVALEGTSAEGRRLAVLRLGSGPTTVLLWSQMHGDEPTATCALLDVLSYLGRNRKIGAVPGLFSKLTIYLLPMLNPDGAERGTRRNAQGIDINRDALRLQTPEGRFLKDARDRFGPAIGYNLHNQSPLTIAGKGGDEVALALLSVPFDEALSENEGRRTTKRLALLLCDALSPWASGKIARYDAGYTARAFGDSMTRWGTATLLIETGGWNGPDEAGTLVRLNFVALLVSLEALADGSLAQLDPAQYDTIPVVEREGLFDLLVREATVLGGDGLPPFLADVALNRPIPFAGTGPRGRSGVVDLGDLSTFRGKEEIAGRGKILVPAPPGGDEGWKKTLQRLTESGLADGNGDLILTPPRLSAEVKRWMPERQILAPGYRGALLLLVPAGDGRLRLEARIDVSGR